MARRKINYKEGDWIAVPLRDEGFAVGRITRVGKSSILFGYFFGPRFNRLPQEGDVGKQMPHDAILKVMFGHLGLMDGTWSIIKRPDTWDRTVWPISDFIRIDLITSTARRVRYDENTLAELEAPKCDISLAQVLPRDGLYGSGAVEIKLTHILKAEG